MSQPVQQNINVQVPSKNMKQLFSKKTSQINQQNNQLNNEIPSISSRPQYRIFKRGDSIPGIPNPIQISHLTMSPSSAEPVTSGDNADALPVMENAILNGLGGSVRDTFANKEKQDNFEIASNRASNNMFNVTSCTPIINGNNGGKSSVNGGMGIRTATPLSQIGEIARFHGVDVSYRLVKEIGPPHAPTFTVLLQLRNEEYTGEGTSIKRAQHAAAAEALEKTAFTRPPPKLKLKTQYNLGGGGGGRAACQRPNWALIQLTNLAQELKLQLQFVQQPVPIADPFRKEDPPSIVFVHVGDRVFSAEGSNFNAAKTMAVVIALKAMLKIKQEADFEKLSQCTDAQQSMTEADNKSPISIVHEMAMKRGLLVKFTMVHEKGPPHMKVFTVNCKVGEDLETEGQGPTKQAAKKASSELMASKLKEIPITLTATGQGANLKAMQRGLLRQKSSKRKTCTPVLKDLEKQTISPISRLIQIAHLRKFKEPEFILVSTGTESNVENFLKQITERDRRMLRKKKPTFTIQVTVGPHNCQGTGPNKKAAKKAAAEAAIISLGYQPSLNPSLDEAVGCSKDSIESFVSTSITSDDSKTGTEGKPEAAVSSTGKLTVGRQITSGVVVFKGEPTTCTATAAAMVEEMKKFGNLLSPCTATSSRDGIDKLAYLARLMEISVSYSNFPKKNEYLSVVSLTTKPPHVAHGCGSTLEEAQNAAALKIMEELSTNGLDSVSSDAQQPS